MSSEVNGVFVQVVVSKDGAHGGGLRVEARNGFPSGGVIILEVLSEHQEILEPPLLEHAHQICRGYTVLKFINIIVYRFLIPTIHTQMYAKFESKISRISKTLQDGNTGVSGATCTHKTKLTQNLRFKK